MKESLIYSYDRYMQWGPKNTAFWFKLGVKSFKNKENYDCNVDCVHAVNEAKRTKRKIY